MTDSLPALLALLAIQLVAGLVCAVPYLNSRAYDASRESMRRLSVPMALIGAAAWWAGMVVILLGSNLMTPPVLTVVVLGFILDAANGVTKYVMNAPVSTLRLLSTVIDILMLIVFCWLGFWWFPLAIVIVMGLVQIPTLKIADGAYGEAGPSL